MNTSYIEHRKRLRERYLKVGIQGFHDYEILELLLTYVIARKDTKNLAKELLKKFKSLSGVLSASAKELSEIKGFGQQSYILFSLVKGIGIEQLNEGLHKVDVLSTPEKVVNFAKLKLADEVKELFMVIYVNSKNHVINYEVENTGTVNHAVVYPREIVVNALKNNATGIILIHNHPSGICNPSQSDKDLTIKIKKAVATVSIKLLDHIIVGKGEAFSFLRKDIL